MKSKFYLIILALVAFGSFVQAQTTAFTFQGSLNDNSTQANGTYQMRFTLFTAQLGGNPVGSSIELPSVQVTEGIFSVELDFGASAFTVGGNRFLQVEVRRNAGETFVSLNPRQQVKSVPYAVRSATSGNADQLGGLSSSQYVTNNSSSFIRNSNTPQIADFAISGNGRAIGLDALEGFTVNGVRALYVTDESGTGNTFVGRSGQRFNLGASRNTTVGVGSGLSLNSGDHNTLVGNYAGNNTTSGSRNTFLGSIAGTNTSSGNDNTFIGAGSGITNTLGSNNTLLGEEADVTVNNLNYATAIGSGTKVSTINTVQIGRTSDRTNVSGVFNVLNGRTSFNERGNVNFFSNSGDLNLYMQGGNSGDGIVLKTETPSSGNSHFFISHLNGNTYDHRLVVKPDGRIEIRVLGTGGNEQLCRNSSTNAISTCSSSIRYKSNVANFSNGLDIIKKLRPVSFNWTEGGMLDFGLVAEEVAEVEPLLTTQNADGVTEGVKYDRVGVVLVNAFKEQQKQIEDQQAEIKKQKHIIEKQQTEIETLKKQQKEFAELKTLVCLSNAEAEICKAEETENETTEDTQTPSNKSVKEKEKDE